MSPTKIELQQAVVYRDHVTIPKLKGQIEKLRASNTSLADDATKLRFEIADLRKENAALRDRNSMHLLRLKQEEQCRENWQERAQKAEARVNEATDA